MSCEFCRVSFDCWLTIREVTPKSMYASFFTRHDAQSWNKNYTFASWRNCVVVILFARQILIVALLYVKTRQNRNLLGITRVIFTLLTRTCRVSLIVVLLYVKTRWIDFTRIMSYNFVPRIAPMVALLYVKARQKSMCARLNFTSTIWSTYKTL